MENLNLPTQNLIFMKVIIILRKRYNSDAKKNKIKIEAINFWLLKYNFKFISDVDVIIVEVNNISFKV